jgi:hypothetical protein
MIFELRGTVHVVVDLFDQNQRYIDQKLDSVDGHCVLGMTLYGGWDRVFGHSQAMRTMQASGSYWRI